MRRRVHHRSGSGKWFQRAQPLLHLNCDVRLAPTLRSLVWQLLAFTYKSDMAFLVVVGQCLVATVLVEIVRRTGHASYDPFNFATAKRWLPVSVFFSAMLFTSFKALEVMNVPMVSGSMRKKTDCCYCRSCRCCYCC